MFRCVAIAAAIPELAQRRTREGAASGWGVSDAAPHAGLAGTPRPGAILHTSSVNKVSVARRTARSLAYPPAGGGIPRVLVWISTPAQPARCAGRAGGRHHPHQGELHRYQELDLAECHAVATAVCHCAAASAHCRQTGLRRLGTGGSRTPRRRKQSAANSSLKRPKFPC